MRSTRPAICSSCRYAGKGTVYSIDATGAGEMRPLSAEASRPRPAMTAILPSGDWRIQRDASGQLLRARTSSSRPTARPSSLPRRDSWTASTSWGVKSSDLHSDVRPDASEARSARLFDRGSADADAGRHGGRRRFARRVRLFVNQGGEGVTTDATGRVYLAAGDVFVYGADGTLIRTIKVPERPLQVVLADQTGRTLFIARAARTLCCASAMTIAD